MIEYIIDEDYESVRVDRFLRKHLKNINGRYYFYIFT